jgi:hypothetical protein
MSLPFLDALKQRTPRQARFIRLLSQTNMP